MIAVDSPRIPPAQLALLRAMSGKPAARAAEFATLFGVTAHHAHRLLNALWKAGLVGRAKRQPGYFWRISREGHRALEALADAHARPAREAHAETDAAILDLLRASPGMTTMGVVAALGRSRAVVYSRLFHLRAKGRVAHEIVCFGRARDAIWSACEAVPIRPQKPVSDEEMARLDALDAHYRKARALRWRVEGRAVRR